MTVSTKVEIKLGDLAQADGAAPSTDNLSIEIQDNDIHLNQVELPDLDGDGVANVTEVAAAVATAATVEGRRATSDVLQQALASANNADSKPTTEQVQAAFQAYTAQLEQKIKDDFKAAGLAAPEIKIELKKVDLTPPQTAVSSQSAMGGSAISAGETITFSLECSKASCAFRCALAGPEPFGLGPCSSPLVLNLSKDGAYTLTVAASDALGNRDTTPAEITFTVLPAIQCGNAVCETGETPESCPSDCAKCGDKICSAAETEALCPADCDKTPPDTAIVKMPSALSNQLSASFEFSCSDSTPESSVLGPQSCSFLCQLDTGVPTPCLNPYNLSNVPEGNHTVSVAAVDAAGNKDATPATFSWSVDATPPETTITKGPPALSNQLSASFEFSCAEPGSLTPGPCSFQCALDAAAFAACASPLTATPLTEGIHTFSVRAIDGAGNFDKTPSVSSFELDRTAPVTVIDTVNPPVSPTNSNSLTITFTADDPDALFECKLDNEPYEACDSPATATGILDGAHSVSVRAMDDAGNVEPVPDVYSWVIDTVAPTAPSIEMLMLTMNPPGSNDTLAGGPGAVAADVSVEIYADPLSPLPVGQAFPLPDGSFPSTPVGDNASPSLYVIAVDEAGNNSAATSLSNDVAPPTGASISINGGAAFTTVAGVTLTLSATGAANMAFSNDGTTYSSWEPYSTSKAWTLTTGDAVKTVSAKFNDAAGNPTTPVTDSISLDTGPPANPTLTLADPSQTTPGATNNNPVNATITDDGTVVGWCLSESQSMQPLGTNPCFGSPKPASFALGVADGAHTAYLWVKDGAGNVNVGTVSALITLDTGAPAAPSAMLITITMNAPGMQDQITGAAGAVEGSATVKVCADGLCTGLLVQFAAAGDGSFTVQNIGDNQGDGSDLVYVFAVDAAGNTSAATSKPNDKTPPPAPTISSTTPTSPSATSTPTVGGGCDATATSVEVYDDGALLGSGSCTASTFSFAPATAVTLNASNTLTAKAVDAAGNVSVASTGFTYLHDNTAPSAIATVNDGAGADIAYQTSTTDMNGNWTSSTDSGSGLLRYEFSAGSTPCGTEQYGWAANAMSTTATAGALALTNGNTYYFNARAVDNAGNIGACTASNGVIVDNVLPTSSISTPTSGAKLAALTSISGTSSDTGSGVQQVEISIFDGTNYWNGSAFATPSISWFVTSGTAPWSYDSSGVLWASGTTYTIQSRATDFAGGAQSALTNLSFTFDSTLPTFAGAAKAEASGNPITISWTAGSDNVTVAGSLVYQICQTTAPGGCGAFTATYTTSAGAVTYTTPALTKNTTYTFVVRAQDEAGNADGNTTEKADAAGGNLWATKAPMPTLRRDAGIAAVNGKIYVLGGSGGATLNEEYDPVANTWAAKASMTYGSTCLGAAAVNGRVYAMNAQNEEYDPVANLWTTKLALPTPRCASLVALKGKIYAIGGGGGALNDEYNPGTNTWAAKAAMPTARDGAAIAAVNGRIYVTGGFGGATLAVNEEYDPVGNVWATKTAMPSGKDGIGSAGVAVNGRVYVIGGYDGSYSTAVQEYDPALNTWANKAAMPTGRFRHAVAEVNGRIYAIGGNNAGGDLTVNEEYTPPPAGLPVDGWNTRAPLTSGRSYFGNAVFGGRLYVFGGYDGSILASTMEYDPLTNSWAAKAPMPTARYGLGAATMGGRIYALGGCTVGVACTTWTAANEEYDPVADSWVARPAMTTPRYALAVVATEQRIYAIGGLQASAVGANEEYDPVANTWASKAVMSPVRGALGAAVLGGRIYVVGGWNSVQVADNQEYDPGLNAWAAKTGMSAARDSLLVTAVNGRIYAIGGHNGTSEVATVEEFDLGANAWTGKTAMPTARYRFGGGAINGRIFAVGGYSVLTTHEVYVPPIP